MKPIISLIAMLTMTSVIAQRNYSDQEIKRLADLGKLWGMLHYFHPKMGTGEIATDSLILSPTASLIADPSAENFERCVKDMLSRLHDPSTQLQKKSVSASSLLFTPDPYKPVVHKLPNDIWYFAFPTAAARWDSLLFMPGMMASQWDSAKAIILDIRNVKNTFEDPAWAFQYYLPAIVAEHLGGAPLSYVYDRSIYHQGFLSQGNRKFNLSGWNIATQGGLPPLPAKGKKFQKPLLIIFNMGTVKDIPFANFIQTVKAAGLCKIVFEGSEAEYPVGKMIKVDLADSLSVNLRVSDFMIGDNQLVPAPDWCIDQVSDTSLSGTFVNRCIELISEMNNGKTTSRQSNLSMRYVPSMPGRYEDEQFPSAEKRLFALYNWWNAIQYFYPYKHLMDRNWDSVFVEYIPRLLNAVDKLSYFTTLVSLVSEINDTHAYVNSFNGVSPFISDMYPSFPPIKVMFIEDRLIVVDKKTDTLQGLDMIETWDEIIGIDGKKMNEVKEKWRTYIKRSNEPTFLRDLPNYLLRGPTNSNITLDVLRKGKIFSVILKRSGFYQFDYKKLYFQDKHSSFQLLENNIGYIKMGQLKLEEVDAAIKIMKDSRAIIFDIRDYPQPTAEIVVNRIACEPRKAVMHETPYVTSGYVTGKNYDSSSLVSYKTVNPSGNGNCYKGIVVVLVNEMTQSFGENLTMQFQAASSKTTVVGSQTAGADGGVLQAVLPGGYSGVFTGTGVKYPDGKQTQRTGIKIDIEVKPTITGFKAGRDEVLLRAIEFIKKGK